jgi:hypothetical protein
MCETVSASPGLNFTKMCYWGIYPDNLLYRTHFLTQHSPSMVRLYFSRRAARLGSQQLKEIWESRLRLFFFFLCVYLQIPLSLKFDLFLASLRLLLWASTITPWIGTRFFVWSALGTTSAAFAAQFTTMLWLWKRFRRTQAQTRLPEPWSNINMAYVLQLSADPGPLRGIHFLLTAVTPRRRKRWHFRHTLNLLAFGTCIFDGANFMSALLLLTALYGMVVYETFALLKKQTESIFGIYSTRANPPLEYWRHPRFAWATLANASAFWVVFIAIWMGHYWLISAMFILPVIVFATLLQSLLHGHKSRYLNQSLQVSSLERTNTLQFCNTCSSTVFSRSEGNGSIHHRTVKGLYDSARAGCRICSAVWERRSKVSCNFGRSLMFWKPATTIGGHLSIRFKEQRYGRDGCKFQQREREGQFLSKYTPTLELSLNS